MVLILTIHDRKGNELNFGDLVKIECYSCGHLHTFYSEVKYLPESQSIAPFHTFAFHSVEKIDRVPDTAKASNTETRYKVWHEFRELEDDEHPSARQYEKYLMEWRECEHLLSEKIFRVHISEETLKPGTQLSLI